MKLKDVINEYGEYEVDKEKLESILVKPKGRWLPKKYELYNSYDEEDEMVGVCQWGGGSFDRTNYKHLNFRIIREEFEKSIEIRIAFQNASFEPDWNDVTQEKIYLYLHHKDKEVELNSCYCVDHGCQYYFENREDALQLINKYSYEDIEKYIFHVH